jgi:hypothetical protein
MTQPTNQQIAEALRDSGPIILAAGPREVPVGIYPSPNEIWDLPGGTAWVFYADGNDHLTRPVIMADGFNSGPSTIAFSWAGLELGGYRMISELRGRGRDVIIVGFAERSASILDNAQAVEEAIFRAIGQRRGDAPLAVGGFSMGGLITRYALADLEFKRMDHQTAVYWSYDSPHRGAWIPISLQAFAHYAKARNIDGSFSDQINSPAAQQLLWRHIPEWNAVPEESKLRTEFRTALERVGGWPRRPRLIGVANGVSSGTGTGLQPGAVALQGNGLAITPTRLYIQSPGENALVADLRILIPLYPLEARDHVRTPALPEIDGAPGGTLEGFGILVDVLAGLPPIAGTAAVAPIRSHCFVPTVSAIAIRDVDTDENLYANIDELSAADSELDEFKCAAQNEEHTKITEELCTWIFNRLP